MGTHKGSACAHKTVLRTPTQGLSGGPGLGTGLYIRLPAIEARPRSSSSHDGGAWPSLLEQGDRSSRACTVTIYLAISNVPLNFFGDAIESAPEWFLKSSLENCFMQNKCYGITKIKALMKNYLIQVWQGAAKSWNTAPSEGPRSPPCLHPRGGLVSNCAQVRVRGPATQ